MSFFDRFKSRGAPKPAPRPAPAPSAPAAVPAPAAPIGAALAEFFTHDHRACDELWAEVEGAADVTAAFEKFSRMMLRHLAWEEEVLFPAFEDATGMHGAGPTQVMRFEHTQMKGLLSSMAESLSDTDALLDLGDTLMMLIQQHNMKEENMLYPMAERALGARWPALREKLQD